MDVREMFRILQIEETRDKSVIKNAYRCLLPQTNPEDDPDGFKRLRQAYEEAMKYADQPEEQEAPAQERDTSPVGLWLEQAEQIYNSLKRRLDPQEWQALFQEDICQALDTAEEVQERFLAFTMNHFRMPQEIWRVIDKEFRILEQRQQLLERFPRDFINFICFEIESGGFMDFTLFEGTDDAAYDQYINLYLQVKRAMDECMSAGPWEDENADTDEPNRARQLAAQVEQLLDQLEDLEIYHPYGDVERLRLAMKADRREEVKERLQLLAWGDGAENTYVLLQCGAAQEYLEELDQARETYGKLLERQPDNYPAGVGMLHCEMQAGQWAEAKERLMDLMDISKNDPHLMDSMHQCNAHLIPQMEARLAEDPEDWHERIELGWCLFQEERSEDCIALLSEKEVPEDKRIEYCNMLSRTYLMRKEYELSLPLLEEWQQLMYALPDSDDPEIKKKKRRIGYSYYAVAFCLQETGRGEEAVACYDKAIELENDEDMLQSYLMGKAHMLCTILHRYEESADVCDQLLERNEQYVPAYICRQECSYRMHRAQAVVDDYHRAVAIYPLFLASYLMAAKVFYVYRQYKNAMEVIQKARDLNLTDMELDFVEARTLRYMADKKEDLDRPKELLRSIIDRLQQEEEAKAAGTAEEKDPIPGADPVEEVEAWKELTFCYMDEKSWSEAYSIVNAGLGRFPGDDGLRYAKAGIMKGMEKYQEAEDIYRQMLKTQPDNTVIMGQLADCMEKSGRREGLEELYKKILDIDPEDIRALSRLMHIYQDRMNDDRDPSWFEPALKLADKLVELQPTAYYYIERGLLLSDVYRLSDAIKDYKKAMELEPDNLYAQNNAGVNYQHLDQFEIAEKYYKKAAELLGDGDESILPWKNLAVLYMIQQRFEEAWKCVEENEKRFPDRGSFYMDRAEILEKSGRFHEAIREYRRYLEKKDAKSKRAMVNIANAYATMGDIREAQKSYRKLLKNFPQDHWVEKQYIEFLLDEARDYRGAYNLLKKRLAHPSEDGKSTFYDLMQMVKTCFYLKKWRERDHYYERAQQVLKYKCGPQGREGYVGLKSMAPASLYHLGLLYLYGGDLQQAEEMFQRMLNSNRCDTCHYGGCYEGLQGMALVRLHQKRFEEAERYFRRCLKVHPHCSVSNYYLNNRRKW